MSVSKSVESHDGVRIVYDVAGDDSVDKSQAIVFVHGWACNRAHWVGQTRAFSDRFKVVAIDLAGHGESGLGRVDYTMPSFAQDVAAVLGGERIEKAVLVGHSMGGMVILHAAHMLGDRVVGLVGADTFKYIREHPGTVKQAEQSRKISEYSETAISDIVSSMFTSDTPEVLRKSITEGMLATPLEVAASAMQGMADDVALFDLTNGLKIPKMTINATGRPMDEEAARAAGVDVRFVPTKGHFVMNEDPVLFNKLLGEALEQMFD